MKQKIKIASLFILGLAFLNGKNPGTGNSKFSTTSEEKEFNVMELEGTYQGENILLLNPYSMAINNYCIKKVSVNGNTVIQDPKYKKLGVNLSSYGEGKYVNVSVIHSSNCAPRVLNPKAILSDTEFEMVDLTIAENQIKWTTNDEKNQQPYEVEQLQFNKWVIIGKLAANGSDGYNNYSVPVRHFSGENKYRIKRRHISRYYYYSKIYIYESEKNEITFSPTRTTDKVYLSEPTEYSVINESGQKMKNGRGTEIDVTDLVAGTYYLQIDNRTERFFKD